MAERGSIFPPTSRVPSRARRSPSSRWERRRKENGDADLSYVEAVARELALSIEGDKVIVEKSTVPARTCDAVERTMMLYGRGRGTFSLASNPGFLREGKRSPISYFPTGS